MKEELLEINGKIKGVLYEIAYSMGESTEDNNRLDRAYVVGYYKV